MRNLIRKSIFWVLSGFFCFFYTSPALSQKVRLAWTASKNPYVTHYGIYRQTSPGTNFTLIGQVKHPDTLFSDTNLRANTQYFYVATAFDKFGNESAFSNMVDTTLTFIDFHLSQNFPNPFNHSTYIAYRLPQSSRVELTIYNLHGNEIVRLVNEFQNSGEYKIQWHANNEDNTRVPSGIYFCRLKVSAYSKTGKMLFLK